MSKWIFKLKYPSSLQGQLLALILLLVSFLFIVIGVLQYMFMKEFLYENKAQSLHSQMHSWPPNPIFLKDFRDVDQPQMKLEQPRPIIFQPGLLVVMVYPNGSTEQLSQDVTVLPPIISEDEYITIRRDMSNNHAPKYYIFKDKSGNEKMVVFRKEYRDNDATTSPLLQVSIELQSLNKQLFIQLGIYAILAFFSIIAALIAGLPLIRKTLRPLHHVVATVNQTDAVNLTAYLPEEGGQTEINQLSQAFNSMLTRLEQSFEAERKSNARIRQFLADASHELRTPITSIRGFIEILIRGAAANEQQLAIALKSMEQESQRMNELLEHLLQLAKFDHTPDQPTQLLSLNDLMMQTEPQLRILGGNRKLHVDIPSTNILIQGNMNQLKQVILNMFQNAVQHTNDLTGEIRIILDHSDHDHNYATIKMIDNGAGIPKEHLPFIFDRFYRGEASRARRLGGSGLGLSISQSIVHAHQGTISVESELHKGTTFYITFPIA